MPSAGFVWVCRGCSKHYSFPLSPSSDVFEQVFQHCWHLGLAESLSGGCPVHHRAVSSTWPSSLAPASPNPKLQVAKYDSRRGRMLAKWKWGNLALLKSTGYESFWGESYRPFLSGLFSSSLLPLTSISAFSTPLASPQSPSSILEAFQIQTGHHSWICPENLVILPGHCRSLPRHAS